MRQRRVKNEGERLAAHKEYIVKDGTSCRGKWAEKFGNDNAVFLELGCGRGKFITTLAEENPENNYIGIEARSSVALRALEKAGEKKLTNTLFVIDMVQDVCGLFREGEIDGLYLNFSDPWPKERHAKRRLTYRSYIESYKKILKSGSFIEIKTDNDGLFDFALEELEACGVEVLEETRDLHASPFAEGKITTEYEERFRLLKEKINYCKAKV